MPYVRQSIRCIALMLMFAVLCGGCGLSAEQKTGITSFASGTSAVAEVTAQHLADMRADTIDVRSELFAMGWDEVNPAAAPDSDDRLEGHFKTAAIETRVAAVTSLKAYADLLADLADNDSATRIQESAGTFLSSVESYKPGAISADKRDAVTKIVGLVASGLIDMKRQQAIEEATAVAHDPIAEILNLLETDIDPTKGVGLAFQLDYTESNDIKAFKTSGAYSAATAGERTTLDARLKTLVAKIAANKAAREPVRAKLLDAIRSVRTANEAIYVSRASAFRIDDIVALRAKAIELVNLYKVVTKSKKG